MRKDDIVMGKGEDMVKRATLALPKKSKIELTDTEKNTSRLRASFADWIGNASAGFNYAATLTYSCQPRDRDEAERKMKCFSDCYNRLFGFGCNANYNKKFNKLKAAPMAIVNDCEYSDGREVNYHHHLALSKPDAINDEEYIRMVNFCWQQCISQDLRVPGVTADFYRQKNILIDFSTPGITEIEPIESGGWAGYLAGKQHIGNQESYDVKNSNIY